MITLFEKFNFRIVNKIWSEPNKDEITKQDLLDREKENKAKKYNI